MFLTFWHQITTGATNSWALSAKTSWYGLYGAVTALALWYRILTPIRLNLRHRMRVQAVIEETPGVVSVLIGGPRLHRMGAEAGQFFRWRFLAPGPAVVSSNPYSLSAAPRPDTLRITVKAIGDHSSPAPRAGARHPGVGGGPLRGADRAAPQPRQGAAGRGRGRHHPDKRPVRDAAWRKGDITLIYRANSTQDLALWG